MAAPLGASPSPATWRSGSGSPAGLAAVAFVTTGGDDSGPQHVDRDRAHDHRRRARDRRAGDRRAGSAPGASATVALFALLAALTAASIAWSVLPNNSWVEASRTLSYLAVFAAEPRSRGCCPHGGPASWGPSRWSATVISAYALLVKVFPATLDANDQFGRLQAPFHYWNATGLIGALGLAPCLWAGARRERARALRALAVPAVSILLTVIVLSYSRGALLVAAIGLACWFAVGAAAAARRARADPRSDRRRRSDDLRAGDTVALLTIRLRSTRARMPGTHSGSCWCSCWRWPPSRA